MANRIPINPAVLTWARRTAGYKIDDLVANKQFSKIAKWESGDESPTYSQLEKLAEKFHRPIVVFFFPKPPPEEPVEKALRSVSESSVENLNPVIHYLFRKAKVFQLSLAELFEGQEEIQKHRLSWLTQAGAIESSSFAERFRSILDVSIEEQQSWQGSDDAFKEWRRRLALRGVFVFKDAFKNTEVSGFCVYDDLFPIIFINNSHPKNRQIFTLFHELCHLLLKQSFLDIMTEQSWLANQVHLGKEESLCNSLASEILVPVEHLISQVGSLPVDNTLVDQLADSYHVSSEVIARKLLDQGLVSRRSYEGMIHEWYSIRERAAAETDKSSGNYYNTKSSYLGDSYISVVLRNYYQGKIDIVQASDYLDIKPKSFPGLEEKFLERAKVDVYL
ncbi:ImmA/IrrE family metallo-endopeptidase [Cyanobium sp. LEGE 06113]|uniref:ImmA/IrrE family metallo-endopeptidase n=1 Tax=Cyanobium sp. LEGE 06113 TaxID=1297573 RepID=UPI00188269B0|nr:ImmA/IrrE family metallo-endopeptidase [Cyanobium sp. LEGE 06113]MBE9153224.1 ImmA/IrrE family metallo-endopeptidase [Cyanobium sp. LEGE 06113]